MANSLILPTYHHINLYNFSDNDDFIMPVDMTPQVVRALSVGTELAFSIIIGAFIGYLIGKSLGGRWLVVGIALGVVLGFVAGIYHLYKTYE